MTTVINVSFLVNGMELTFLGTSSMVPTKERNVVGHFLDYQGDGFLIDCGEGTQRQMNIAGINRLRATTVLLSHWHGDHVAGLIGFLQTVGNADTSPAITIIGPRGTEENLHHLMQAVIHDTELDLTVQEYNPRPVETVAETERYAITCRNLHHQVPTLAYRFQEKDRTRVDMERARELGLEEGPVIGRLQQGETVEHDGTTVEPEQVTYEQEGKSIAFVMDTAVCDNAVTIAEDVDVLVCESTYSHELEEQAAEYRHLTARQAGEIADRAGAEKLVLTHFSQRYPDTSELVAEAERVFTDVTAASDFMQIEL